MRSATRPDHRQREDAGLPAGATPVSDSPSPARAGPSPRALLRRLFLAVLVTLITAGGFLFSVVTRILSPRGGLSYLVAPRWSRALLASLGIRARIKLDSPLDPGPYVIVANHTSMLDICVTAAVLPLPFHFASRPFFFKLPFLGWGMYLAGHLSLDPLKPRQAAKALSGLGKRFARGFSILLFPEGTRSPDGRLLTFHRGPFLAAIRNQVPVLLLYLEGVHPLLPRGSLDPRPGEARVHVGPVLPTAGLRPADSKSLAAQAEAWTREMQRASAAAD